LRIGYKSRPTRHLARFDNSVMLLKLGAALLFTALCLASLFGYRTYTKHRDIAETLQWMEQTYNPYENGWGGHGTAETKCEAKCEEVGLDLTFRETLSHRGCQLTTVTTSNRKEDHGLHETFNLRDIDSGSIRLSSNRKLGHVSDVEFATRNNAQVLFYTENINGNGARSEFMMDDAEYAVRFATAFKHSVELCGGQPSKF
jgi:hypothetical protein